MEIPNGPGLLVVVADFWPRMVHVPHNPIQAPRAPSWLVKMKRAPLICLASHLSPPSPVPGSQICYTQGTGRGLQGDLCCCLEEPDISWGSNTGMIRPDSSSVPSTCVGPHLLMNNVTKETSDLDTMVWAAEHPASTPVCLLPVLSPFQGPAAQPAIAHPSRTMLTHAVLPGHVPCCPGHVS